MASLFSFYPLISCTAFSQAGTGLKSAERSAAFPLFQPGAIPPPRQPVRGEGRHLFPAIARCQNPLGKGLFPHRRHGADRRGTGEKAGLSPQWSAGRQCGQRAGTKSPKKKAQPPKCRGQRGFLPSQSESALFQRPARAIGGKASLLSRLSAARVQHGKRPFLSAGTVWL